MRDPFDVEDDHGVLQVVQQEGGCLCPVEQLSVIGSVVGGGVPNGEKVGSHVNRVGWEIHSQIEGRSHDTARHRPLLPS